jgi:hypothetical protein
MASRLREESALSFDEEALMKKLWLALFAIGSLALAPPAVRAAAAGCCCCDECSCCVDSCDCCQR